MKPDKAMIVIFTLTVLLLMSNIDPAQASQTIPLDWELHEIEMNQDGSLHKTAGDPYIVFPEIEQQNCTLNGVQFVIRFEPMAKKPFYMELFWRPSYEGFGEDRKVFFIIPPTKDGDTVDFTVPLEQQGGLKQVRLDLPGDLESTFSIEQYRIVSLDKLPEGTLLVDSYFRMSASAASNPDIIIPYLTKTLQHGMVRMTQDPVFLVFWLLMIGGLLTAHRFLLRSAKHNRP